MNHKIKIQIAYALPNHYYLKAFTVDDGTMVQTAILQSGILTQLIYATIRWVFLVAP